MINLVIIRVGLSRLKLKKDRLYDDPYINVATNNQLSHTLLVLK